MSETTDTSADQVITVEVAYALPGEQKIIALEVPLGTTARQAVKLSNIADNFPDIDVESAAMGIFSQVLGSKGLPGPDDYCLQPLDRVEIYRSLLADPKEVRKQRAAKARQLRTEQKDAG
ncbi:MAG: RnfH family protein [Porticoccaceae bacterium]|nr:RnfH family protein [Porticoccaceae bacterium]